MFLGAGMAPLDAFHAFVVAIDYVTTWSKAEDEMRRRSEERPGLDAAAKRALTDGTYPNLARVAEAFLVSSDLDEHFAFGLETLIAGFERLIP